MIGVGGTPYSPEWMFCLPLDEADSPTINACVYLDRESDPQRCSIGKTGASNEAASRSVDAAGLLRLITVFA